MMIFKRFLNTLAAALALALVLALAGCVSGASSSVAASVAPVDSVPPTASVAESTPEPAVSDSTPQPEDTFTVAEGGYPTAPEGPFTPVTEDELNALTGSWIFWPNGEENESGGMVWQLRFGQPGPGQLSISKGIFETDAGVFFSGGWRMGEGEGVYTADLQIMEMGEPDNPPVVTAEFLLAWAGDAKDLLLFTLLSYDDSADPRFGEAFADWLDLAIPTYNAW